MTEDAQDKGPREFFHYIDPVTKRLTKADSNTMEVISVEERFEDYNHLPISETPNQFIAGHNIWRYSERIRDVICEYLTEGKTLTAICAMPNWS